VSVLANHDVVSVDSDFLAPETWSTTLRQAADSGDLKIVPYDVQIGYNLWSYRKSRQQWNKSETGIIN
jgi:hypothetical protein